MPTHPVASTLVPLQQIHSNPDQPRKSFDPADLQDLKDSIRQRGLINPISVKQRGEGDYVIIAGERRFRAVSDLGWAEIDARIWPAATPTEEAELLSLVENVQRKDLNPIEIAKGYQALSQNPYNMTQEQIAREVGKPQPVVANFLNLLAQPAEIQDFISRDIISASHIRFIGRIADLQERVKLAQRAAHESWSSRETEKQVNKLLAKPERDAKKEKEQKETPIDPLFPIWSRAATDGELQAPGAWNVSYGPLKGRDGKRANGWTFTFIPNEGPARAKVATWLQRLGATVADHLPEKQLKKAADLSEEDQQLKQLHDSLSQNAAPIPSELSMRMLPANKREMDQMMQEQAKRRLPKDAKEWAEIEALAPKGPGAVYGWVFGAESLWCQKVSQATWQDMGEADPVAASHRLIEGLPTDKQLTEEPEGQEPEIKSPEEAQRMMEAALRKAKKIAAKHEGTL